MIKKYIHPLNQQVSGNKTSMVYITLNLLNYVYNRSFHYYLTEYSLCTDFSFKCNKYDLKNPGQTVPQNSNIDLPYSNPQKLKT